MIPRAAESTPERLTTGRVYLDYDKLVQRIAAWVDTKNPRVRGCEDLQVRARLVQCIVALTSDGYARQAAQQVDKSGCPLPPTSQFVVVNGLKICRKSGAVSISVGQWLKHFSLFAAAWLHMLAFLFAAIFRRSPKETMPATLLMEAGAGSMECDDRFVRFCRNGLIGPLSSAKFMIIRSPQPPLRATDSSFVYARHPLVEFATRCLRRPQWVLLFASHLRAPLTFLHAIFACPASVLRARDIAFVPMVRCLDRKSLIEAVVITTSSFGSQPLWMKGLVEQHFKLHMVWYSQNFIPKIYLGEREQSSLPPARHMRVDVHWVWTDGFKFYLESLGQKSEIKVVGPILWYLQEKKSGLIKSCVQVALFDVLPLPDEQQPFGAIKNYYSVSTISRFVADGVELCREMEHESGWDISVRLKHKRIPRIGRHDSQYLEFLETLSDKNPRFQLMDDQTDLFEFLEQSHFSVSVPYTSTAYVAAFLDRPAIYYDPFNELIPAYENNDRVHFASSKIELRRLMRACLNLK